MIELQVGEAVFVQGAPRKPVTVIGVDGGRIRLRYQEEDESWSEGVFPFVSIIGRARLETEITQLEEQQQELERRKQYAQALLDELAEFSTEPALVAVREE